ncbi:hypothetical protein [Cellulophaga sp. Hel_I_12]|uniref:hypothetical protein n=1 Tax=Cellulophaga sp. Hel_I_12 TaxID=1249972 RepID=UPI0006457BDC|nr:hypothetical protein [Cellulophaga sp. Hel_I_12]
MRKSHKKGIQIIGAVLTLLLAVYAALHFMVKVKIEEMLKGEVAKSFEVQYKDFGMNLILGNVSLSALQVKSKDTSLWINPLKINRLEIKGINFFELYQSGNFKINSVLFDAVKGDFAKQDSVSILQSSTKDFKKVISIKNLILKNSYLTQVDPKNDSVLVKFENLNVQLEDFKLDSTSLASKVPIAYKAYHLNSGPIYVNLSPFEKLEIDSLYTDQNLVIQGFHLVSKYDKVALQSKLTKERDFIDLQIPVVEIDDFQCKGYKDSSLLSIRAIELNELYLEMYRNKLLPDDYELKELLYKKIENLPFKIDIRKVDIKKGEIAYTELVNELSKAGKIYFTALNSTIENISNLNGDPIIFKNTANLMGVSPITLDWTFRENSNKNLMLVKGTVMNFNTKAINSFMMSNLRAKSSGTIQELYFTFSGNGYSSTGDMKMKYDDFKFQVLKKDRSGVNKVLTFIGNIFTNDGSNTNDSGYRFGTIETERDNTKSFFNYIWKNVSDGLVSTLTGNGEKE